MLPVQIRPYEPKDRAAVREIFQLTAYHGEPFPRFFDDGEWLADFTTDYYLEEEPASTFVAEEDGRVVGYLTGSVDTRRTHSVMTRRFFTKTLPSFFAHSVWRSGRAWRFLWNGIRGGLRGDTAYPSWIMDQYPAHLHINLRESHRGRGVGAALFSAFRRRLDTAGVTAVHARTSRADGRHPFFESLGFRPILRRRLRVWAYLDPRPFELITYGLTWSDVKTLS